MDIDRPHSGNLYGATIKADRDELVVTESRYAVGERGPDRHVHREHCDCFWVLEGELTFEVGAGEQVRVPAGAFVLVPPLVVHTFGNDGPGEARFLNVHAPGQGFADHLRAQQEGSDGQDAERFDTFDPPPDGGRPASEAVVRLPGDGERIPMGSSSIVFKAQQENAGGALALMETTVGSYVVIPPGSAHTFSNPSRRPVRFLNLMTPAGLEQYLKEAAAATPPGRPPDPQAMAAIASGYDFEPAA